MQKQLSCGLVFEVNGEVEEIGKVDDDLYLAEIGVEHGA